MPIKAVGFANVGASAPSECVLYNVHMYNISGLSVQYSQRGRDQSHAEPIAIALYV